MDIYELKEMGHSGFENCRIVDMNAYNAGEGQPDALFEGDFDDAPDCLDDLEITSLDIEFNEKANQIEVTIDVDGCNEETMEKLHAWRDEEGSSYEYLVRDADTGEVVAYCDDEEEAQGFIDTDDGEHNYEIVENA